EPPSLHPAKATDTTSSAVLDQGLEGLTRINQETGEPEEAMAEEIDVSDDGLTYTFTIRDDATWTNAAPVTADDFEYAWKWVLDQVLEGWTRINQETAEAEEAMAEEIDVSDDGLPYTFTIRDDATWTNGDPVTADDFEYAWKWVLDPENADTEYSYQLYPIKGAEAADTDEGSLDDVGVTAEDE